MSINNIESTKKIKLLLAIIYLSILCVFLYLFFSNFGIKEITSYEFIQSNREYFSNLKQNNIFILLLSFLLITIFWVLLLGFGSPIALFGGFVFGKWLGSIIVTLGLTIGATFLYILGCYFLKDIINQFFKKKFSYLENKFKSNTLIIIIIYRIIGLVPFGIANLLPALFNIKVKDYFLGTLIGIFPAVFIMVSLGSGIENVISLNKELPSIFSVITLPEIYLPIIGFAIMVIISFKGKKIFKSSKRK